MSEIERVPSMRKSAKQGVPKKPRRDMARPASERKPEKAVAPDLKAAPIESVPSLPVEHLPEPEAVAPEPEPEPVVVEPEPIPVEPEPIPVEPPVEPEPEPMAAELEPVPVPAKPEPESLPAAADQEPPAMSMRETIRRVDESFASFRAAAARFPLERMDEHLSEGGWTRKQMLAHIAAWHDLAADRLVKFMLGGQPVYLDRDTDAINASVARQAIGKTAGEVLKDVEMTYNRLHRQMSRLTEVQLQANDAWAAHIIGGNTFEHYAEHAADLYMPEPEAPAGRR